MNLNNGGHRIDRKRLVQRHNPKVKKVDPLSTFAVGNGEFAFNADFTGLQTFPESYRQIPLCTQAQWGWHTTPPPSGVDPSALRLREYDTFGRFVGYPTDPTGQEKLFNWLRENPHRLHLGRIGFVLLNRQGDNFEIGEVEGIDQELDLWTGVLSSRFLVEGEPVAVETCCDPHRDAIAVTVRSPLIAQERLRILIAFPYGSPQMDAADWTSPSRHTTEVAVQSSREALFSRRLDSTTYRIALKWAPKGRMERRHEHTFHLIPIAEGERFEFVASFSPQPPQVSQPLDPAQVKDLSREYWQQFWTDGAVVELADSKDPRALELERRVVLSQYLTAVHCAGSMPPQETGLVCNSWYGKFHLEMHWWHAIHFPLWRRSHLLEKSLGWYHKMLPVAKAKAQEQGYTGARWPKMVGPEGIESPSTIAPLLIWQQPHPLMYAESCYREKPTLETLKKFEEIVFETAEFMASFAVFDEERGRYVLGPPVIPAQECHPPESTTNPTFELAYWRYGLQIAGIWRKRLGLDPEAKWNDVMENLAELPSKDGVYLAHENCPETFTEKNHDHPSMLGALGILPGDGVDHDVMRRTLNRVMQKWRWEHTWGWDYPMTALCAARLGMPEVAIEALFMDSPKNTYLNNGHNWQRDNLPVYLPGNGGLLIAIAAMAAGWKGAPNTHAPGFPSDGSWVVRWEGLRSWF